MDKNELLDNFIKIFADYTAHNTKEERRNMLSNELIDIWKTSPGFNEQKCKEMGESIAELVEKELKPVDFIGTVMSNSSAGIGIKYTMPNSAKDGYIYIDKNDKFKIGDKCVVTIKKI